MNMIRIFTQVCLGLFILFLMTVLSAGFLLANYFKSIAKESININEAIVEIPYGSSLRLVSEILFAANVINSDKKFYWYLRIGRKDSNKIQAGYYSFDGELTNKQIADRLLLGRDRSFKIVFKEGQTLVDLANILEDMGLASKAEFQAAITSDEIVKMINAPTISDRNGLSNDIGGIEGYLFPDTYFLTKKDGALKIIKKMHQRLLEKLNGNVLARLKESQMSLHEVLTLAAIIEKETSDESERPLISSVYHNRLKLGMKLQADPTVIYGIKNYDGKIRKLDLLTYHPYNTYKIVGLPPGPIAAPGIKSIYAALWPQNSDYLYFVSKNDGTHVFCQNLICHNQAVRKWQIDFFKAAKK
jgi:UPF0755 protein